MNDIIHIAGIVAGIFLLITFSVVMFRVFEWLFAPLPSEVEQPQEPQLGPWYDEMENFNWKDSK